MLPMMDQFSPSDLFNDFTVDNDETGVYLQSPDIDMFHNDEKKEHNSEETLSKSSKSIQKSSKDQKKYQSISNELRLKLLDAVLNKGEKIKHVAKRLSINYSSAKAICQIFRREGRSSKKIFKRKSRKDEQLTNSQPLSTNSGFVPYNSDKTNNLQEVKPLAATSETNDLSSLTDRLNALKNQIIHPYIPNQKDHDYYDITKNQAINFQNTNVSLLNNFAQEVKLFPLINQQQKIQNNLFPTEQLVFQQPLNFAIDGSGIPRYLVPEQQAQSLSMNTNAPKVIFITPQMIPNNNIGFPSRPLVANLIQNNVINSPQMNTTNIQNNLIPSGQLIYNNQTHTNKFNHLPSQTNQIFMQNVPFQQVPFYYIPQQQISQNTQMNRFQSNPYDFSMSSYNNISNR